MKTIAVKADDKKQEEKALAIKKESAPIVKDALALKVKTAKDMISATAILSTLNKFMDAVKKEKGFVIDPLKLVIKHEESRWKPIETEHKAAIEALRSKTTIYQTEKINAERAEEKAIADRTKEGRGNFSMDTAEKKMQEIKRVDTAISTEAGVLKFREVPKLKITDAAAIPEKFLIIDEAAVFAALKRGEKVPGAEIEIIQSPVNYR